jgi:hypothetical protein
VKIEKLGVTFLQDKGTKREADGDVVEGEWLATLVGGEDRGGNGDLERRCHD